MRRFYSIVAYLLAFLPVFSQSGSLGDFVSIREAMSVVDYRRYHPTVSDEDMDEVVASVARRHGYKAQDFQEGLGTCYIWQYIKGGHVSPVISEEDYFIPDDLTQACTFSAFDCAGIETIVNDETAIDVEMRLYNDRQRKALMQQMADIGFKYKKYDQSLRHHIYEYQSYQVDVSEGSSRGYKYWEFTVSLNLRDYGSTKNYCFADSSSIHKLEITIDYPVKGHPKLLRQVRTMIMEALEEDMILGIPMARFNGDPSDGRALVNYYGRKGADRLKKEFDTQARSAYTEDTKISKVAENDYYISFEVFRDGWYWGGTETRHYGATFRKSDGQRLHIIASPDSYEFRQFLSNGGYKHQLPFPKYEPFLLQSGVRIIYQEEEIGALAVGSLKGESSFLEIWKYLSYEAKEVVMPGYKAMHSTTASKQTDNITNEGDEAYDVVEVMPQFPGGPQALFQYLTKKIEQPIVTDGKGVQGRVIVTFIVERDGTTSNHKITKSVNPFLDEEALRLIKSMPRWSPGKQNGKAVRVKYTAPVSFRSQ